QNLFFVAAMAMKKNDQWVGVIRLIARRQKRSDRPAARRLHFRSIESFRRPKQTPGKISVRHDATYRAKRSGFAIRMGCATRHYSSLPWSLHFDSRKLGQVYVCRAKVSTRQWA